MITAAFQEEGGGDAESEGENEDEDKGEDEGRVSKSWLRKMSKNLRKILSNECKTGKNGYN